MKYINEYERQWVDQIREMFESGITTTFSTLITGLAIVKIIETMTVHIRNRKKHFFSYLYYFHIFTITFFALSDMFWSYSPWGEKGTGSQLFLVDESWEIPLTFMYLEVFNYFVMIFMIYMSLPSSDDLSQHFLCLGDFYKKSINMWLPAYIIGELVREFVMYIDRTIAGDLQFWVWCYDSTYLSALLAFPVKLKFYLVFLGLLGLVAKFKKNWMLVILYICVWWEIIQITTNREYYWIMEAEYQQSHKNAEQGYDESYEEMVKENEEN